MQLNTLTRWLQAFSNYPFHWALRKVILPLYDRQTSAYLDPPAGPNLQIVGAGNTAAKNGTAFFYLANGVLNTIAANTSMPALAGTILQNNFGGWAFFADSGGNLSSLFMNQAAALSGVTFPQFPMGKCFFGFLTANPTAANFVGGTTALDAASTNVVYHNATEAIDPYCLIGGQLGTE